MSDEVFDVFQVGPWTADINLNTLTSSEESIALEPKAMQVLHALAQQAGETVSRQKIFEQCWPNQVVTEDALNRVISALRRALKDNHRAPKFIVTVRNAGYKLVVPVKPLIQDHEFLPNTHKEPLKEQLDNVELSEINKNTEKQETSLQGFIMSTNGLLSITCFIVVACLIWLSLVNTNNNSPIDNTAVTKRTYNEGQNRAPMYSADGTELSYIEVNTNQPNQLKTYTLPSNYPAPITSSKWHVLSFTYVGNTRNKLAVVQNTHTNKYAILKIDAAQKTHKVVKELRSESKGISFDADTNSVFYTQANSSNQHIIISWQLGSDSELLPVTTQAGSSDRHPKNSPIENRLAFIRNHSKYQDEIYLRTKQGQAAKISQVNDVIYDFSWINEDKIIYSSRRGLFSLKLGTALSDTLIHPSKEPITDITYNKNKQILTYAKSTTVSANRIVDFMMPDKEKLLSKAEANDGENAVSPDGYQLALVSNRTGYKSVWLRKRNQLAAIEGTKADEIFDLSWSPDSTKIALAIKRNLEYSIEVYDVTQGNITTIWQSMSATTIAGWRNRETIIFGDKKDDTWHVKSIRVSRSKEHAVTLLPVKASHRTMQIDPVSGKLIFQKEHEKILYQWDFNSAEQPINSRSMPTSEHWFAFDNNLYQRSGLQWQTIAPGTIRPAHQIVKTRIDNNTHAKTIAKQKWTVSPALTNDRMHPVLYGFSGAVIKKQTGDLFDLKLSSLN